MANRTTAALTENMYREFLEAMKTGGKGFRKNPKILFAMVLEANLGLRIVDIRNLKLCDIIWDNGRYRLDVTEQKTGKKRNFTVPDAVYEYMKAYCERNEIPEDVPMLDLSERTINQYIQKVADYLGYDNIGTHSFRKFYATRLYENNGNDIVLVQTLLQHSSVSVTRRYLGLSDEKIERAIENHVYLPE